MALSPNAGLKPIIIFENVCLVVCQNGAKPERGIETFRFVQLRTSFLVVRMALSPNAGLKPLAGSDWPVSKQSQNGAKPERGIETRRTLLRARVDQSQNGAKPERG